MDVRDRTRVGETQLKKTEEIRDLYAFNPSEVSISITEML